MPDILKFPEPSAGVRLRNRRLTIRYRCAPATAGLVAAQDALEFQRVWVDNLSQTGVGFYLSRPLASGTHVLLQLKTFPSETSHDLTARVVHATVREPYGWYVGAEFAAPLDDLILDALL